MLRHVFFGFCFILAFSTSATGQKSLEEQKECAEQLFRSVYGGQPEKIDNLISDDMVSSYPIFEELFNTKTIRGRNAYIEFAKGFSERWIGARITIHEAIADRNRVVLIWSFCAKRAVEVDQQDLTSGQVYSWGGITLFRFNESGRITAEIGEESSPGPYNRLEPESSE